MLDSSSLNIKCNMSWRLTLEMLLMSKTLPFVRNNDSIVTFYTQLRELGLQKYQQKLMMFWQFSHVFRAQQPTFKMWWFINWCMTPTQDSAQGYLNLNWWANPGADTQKPLGNGPLRRDDDFFRKKNIFSVRENIQLVDEGEGVRCFALDLWSDRRRNFSDWPEHFPLGRNSFVRTYLVVLMFVASCVHCDRNVLTHKHSRSRCSSPSISLISERAMNLFQWLRLFSSPCSLFNVKLKNLWQHVCWIKISNNVVWLFLTFVRQKS